MSLKPRCKHLDTISEGLLSVVSLLFAFLLNFSFENRSVHGFVFFFSVPAKRLAGKSISKMTCFVTSGV